jgi:hypothetical protein
MQRRYQHHHDNEAESERSVRDSVLPVQWMNQSNGGQQ